ncbi:MAG: hypothetical protein Ct9H90mP16_11500 [Candidatus Poseidoniales archaeon]|nr:MAG: hypothetical protein Ct9H90mP16_11500 [Candidatus Poseidoniales archaeon]
MLETEACQYTFGLWRERKFKKREFLSADLDTLALDVFTQAGDAIQMGNHTNENR